MKQNVQNKFSNLVSSVDPITFLEFKKRLRQNQWVINADLAGILPPSYQIGDRQREKERHGSLSVASLSQELELGMSLIPTQGHPKVEQKLVPLGQVAVHNTQSRPS